MSRKIVETFTKDTVIEKSHEVEYRDSEGEWCSAAGKWADGALRINSSYPTHEGARIVAKELTRVHGWPSRVVEVTE